jgi:hypothetical protein
LQCRKLPLGRPFGREQHCSLANWLRLKGARNVNPPTPAVAQCLYSEDSSGTPICKKHGKPLVKNTLDSAPGSNPPGLGHLSAFVCPVSQDNVFCTDFPR